jgi:hypothetical protein
MAQNGFSVREKALTTDITAKADFPAQVASEKQPKEELMHSGMRTSMKAAKDMPMAALGEAPLHLGKVVQLP